MQESTLARREVMDDEDLPESQWRGKLNADDRTYEPGTEQRDALTGFLNRVACSKQAAV